MNKIGIYVHIPFCKQKCKYCDFVSYAKKENMFEEYFNCILKEIEEKSNDYSTQILNGKVQKVKVDTIYLGGGTPSIVDVKFIKMTIDKIKQCFNVEKNAEITIEVNPGTCNKEKLNDYYNIGINRISIGLQSTNDRLLKLLGRIHNYNQFEETYKMAQEAGLKNVNVDLMIGLPTQTLQDVEESLNKIIELNPKHISVYSLIVEEGTKIYDLINEGNLVLPDEEIERKMYWNVKTKLEENGYKHYEISNFAKPKYMSKHNLNCWKQHSYIGIGAAAHSYFGGMRFSNIESLKKYIDNFRNNKSVHNIIFHERQDNDSMMKEYMLLGLRTIYGVNITEFKNKFLCNPIYIFRNELDSLYKKELIIINDNNIKLSDKGLNLANLVWSEFI